MGQQGTGVHRQTARNTDGMFGHSTRDAITLVSPSSRFFVKSHVQLRGHSVWTASPGPQKHGSSNGSRTLQT